MGAMRWLVAGWVSLCVAAAGCSSEPDAASGPDGAAPLDSGAPLGDSALSGAETRDSTGEADTGAPLGRCLAPVGADPSRTVRLDDPLGSATVTIDERAACARRYTLNSTATRRDDLPASPRVIDERPGWPTLRSGHDLFDALYALALDEVRQCSVEEIRDGAFDHGAPVDCGAGGCFETGRKWTYVWTRDTAYAIDLGLASLDPARALGSLRFKLSGRRDGGAPEIVQDTGSGGSYPVSTDRVAWARGARALLPYLDGAQRQAFAAEAYAALVGTIERDRALVFDPDTGLYFGEQSFLDWREQSYPAWTQHDVIDIATSRSLSTNALHYDALRLSAELAAELGETEAASRYATWATELRGAINQRLWLEDEGALSTYLPSYLDPAPARRWDLLGASLAIISGIVDDERAARILASYPHYGPGAPVIWPQQQHIAIYHNRAEWPFVSAYWLRAAKRAGNDAVAERMIGALMRGAALNLSNMENLEAGSGAPWLDDGVASGPVVNSQRQLWSVAGYLSMVHHTLFGLEASGEGLRVRPWLPRRLRDGLFGGTERLVLNGWPYRGHRITVALDLPPRGDGIEGGSLSAVSLKLNGVERGVGSVITPDELAASDLIELSLELDPRAPAATLREVDASDWRQVFGPRTPVLSELEVADGRLQLRWSTSEDDRSQLAFDIYRDGRRVARGVPGSASAWTDPESDAAGPASPCYAVEASFTSGGNHSQRSRVRCWWGEGDTHLQIFDATQFEARGGQLVVEYGEPHYQSWGAEGDTLEIGPITPQRGGDYLLQVRYGNGAGPLNTGITCAVKRLRVTARATGAVVADGALVMPQLGRWDRWALSSFVPAQLSAGEAYDVVIYGDDTSVNMSSLEHFTHYTGGTGGGDGPYDFVNISELRVLAR